MKSPILFIDFETRSECDLKEKGADNYANHPSTDIICFGYAVDGGPVRCLVAPDRQFRNDVANARWFVAHNMPFDFCIWNNIFAPKFKLPPLQIEQCRCTMAASYAMGLPGSLEKAAHALGINQEKDKSGQRVMLQLSKPKGYDLKRKVYYYHDEVEHKDKYDTLYRYCAQDIEVTRQLHKRLLPLSVSEQELWILDHQINARGISIDTKAASAMVSIVAIEQQRLNEEMRKVTDNQVATCSANQQLTEWINSNGVETEGVAKSDVTELLNDVSKLPSNVYKAVLLRQQYAKTSTAKLSSLLKRVSYDDRLRNTLQFCGAGTGRWAGRGVQIQNLPRPTYRQKTIDSLFDVLHKDEETTEDKRDIIESCYGTPMEAIASLIRGCFISSPGHSFVSCDYSNIEGRVLAWLAGEEWKLNAFKAFDNKSGPDIYRLSASRIFNRPVDEISDDQRQVGKVAELALGYQGGKNAFAKMAKGYNVHLSDKKIDSIKNKWRDAHSSVVSYWYELERVSLSAVRDEKSRTYFVGVEGRKIKLRKNGSFLLLQLPSKRVLTYPYPKIETIKTPWGEEKEALTYMGLTNNQWVRQNSYGGLLAENITQAVARDILAGSLKRLSERGYPVVMHVHDSIVSEINDKSPRDLETMKKYMLELPTWAVGLPLNAEGYCAKRFQK